MVYACMSVFACAHTSNDSNPLTTTFILMTFQMTFYCFQWGLHKRITLRVLLLAGSHPLLLLAGFMLTTFSISMFISNSATCVMIVRVSLILMFIQLIIQHKQTTTEWRHCIRKG